MNTGLYWLLMSMAAGGHTQQGVAPPTVIERFASKEECERVSEWLRKNGDKLWVTPKIGCIQATVVKEK